MVTNVSVRVNSFVAAAILSIIAMTATPAAASGLIYVNRCAAGCTVTGGPDNAINGTSTIFVGTKNLSAFAHTDITFGETVGKYLVKNRVFDPFGRLHGGHN